MIKLFILLTSLSLLNGKSYAASKVSRFTPSCEQLLSERAPEQLYQLVKTLTLMEGSIQKHLELIKILGQGYKIVGHPVELRQLSEAITTTKIDVFSASRESNGTDAQARLERARQLTEHVEFLESRLWNLTQPIDARSVQGLEEHSWSSPDGYFEFP